MSKPHGFFISHFNGDEDFKAGHRPHSLYRDLGVADATGGMVLAHVVRAAYRVPGGVGGPHQHLLLFHFCYMLRGWQSMRFDGVKGIVTAKVGSAWIQPAGVTHEVVDFSDDREILEITLPANFQTVDAEYSPSTPT